LFCLVSPTASAQYEVDQDKGLWVRGLVDVRVAEGGPAPSWTDGGPGKLRYGGSYTASGFESTTRVALSELVVEAGALLPGDMRAQIQLNVQPDIANGYRPWIVEAILRKELGAAPAGWGFQAGVMNVPFSLEHDGPAWSPAYTVSASALNSWLWEDISLAGVEGEWWRVVPGGIRLGVLAGAGFGADQVGKLLALRGWAMGDNLSGINGTLALPGNTSRLDVFTESDHRPAFYTWLTLGDQGEMASLNAGFFDNGGDEDKPGVWHTHFNIVGLTLHPHARVDVLAQYLDGKGRVASPANDSAMSAYYVLLSYHQNRQRVSVRYDSFRVHDLDGGPTTTNEHGHGVTASYWVELGLRHRIALEHVWLNSDRAASPLPDATQDGWQLSYRFRY
jgi:hypothetical protein